MIARVIETPPYQPTEPQREVKKILQDMTGMGVRIVPCSTRFGPTVDYTFACGFSNPKASKDARDKDSLACHNYLKKLVMTDTGGEYDRIFFSMAGGGHEAPDGIYPYTVVRFADIMGRPTPDEEALAFARQMQKALGDHVQKTVKPAQLRYYQKQVKGDATFKDGFASELGR